jgi:hypothetical protein
MALHSYDSCEGGTRWIEFHRPIVFLGCRCNRSSLLQQGRSKSDSTSSGISMDLAAHRAELMLATIEEVVKFRKQGKSQPQIAES